MDVPIGWFGVRLLAPRPEETLDVLQPDGATLEKKAPLLKAWKEAWWVKRDATALAPKKGVPNNRSWFFLSFFCLFGGGTVFERPFFLEINNRKPLLLEETRFREARVSFTARNCSAHIGIFPERPRRPRNAHVQKNGHMGTPLHGNRRPQMQCCAFPCPKGKQKGKVDMLSFMLSSFFIIAVRAQMESGCLCG